MRPRCGFTLIETLLAVMISGMIMTAVLASVSYTQSAVDAVHNVIETENAGPRILAQIREDLSRMCVYDADEYRVFLGEDHSIAGADADRMDFLVRRRSTRPQLDFSTGRRVYAPLVEVGYRLRQNPESSDFLELYRREDFLHDEDPFRDGSFTLLYDRVVNFQVRYLERPELDPIYEDNWDSEEMEGLPFAIEIELEIEIQPRVSRESLGILGANRARYTYQDIITLPEELRWVFRNRLHPVRPAPGGGAESGETGGGGEEIEELGGDAGQVSPAGSRGSGGS